MKRRYEEKTFESYFNSELSRRSIFYFPLGQVQEGSIGADALAFTDDRWLWRKLGKPFWFKNRFSGIPYRKLAEEMEAFLNEEIANVPAIRTNLLFQFKRSEYMVSSTATEWSSWGHPYFRYDIDAKQQSLLNHLNSQFSNLLLILYAAPALQDVNELTDCHVNHKIIANTNFRPAAHLVGHDRNTFIAAGTASIAHSEPVSQSSFDLLEHLNQLPASTEPNAHNIIEFANKVMRVLQQDGDFGSAFQTLFDNSLSYFHELKVPLLRAHAILSILRELTGIQWLIVTNEA